MCTAALPVLNASLSSLLRAAHMDSMSEELQGNRAGRWVLLHLPRQDSIYPLPAGPAVLLPPPQGLGASVPPRSSSSEAFSLCPCQVAVGLLKNSAALGSFCRITADVIKLGLPPEMGISASLTFIVSQQICSSPCRSAGGFSADCPRPFVSGSPRFAHKSHLPV